MPRMADGRGVVVEGSEEVDDDLYQDAVRVVCEMGRASTSTLQHRPPHQSSGKRRHSRPTRRAKAREVLKTKDWMREFDEGARYLPLRVDL
jgi:hypothetical protein